jgi:hypothetical protein
LLLRLTPQRLLQHRHLPLRLTLLLRLLRLLMQLLHRPLRLLHRLTLLLLLHRSNQQSAGSKKPTFGSAFLWSQALYGLRR